MKLKRSNDRKTANLANAKGDASKIKNSFGLPAGREFSCPGETDFCGSICYGKRIENYLPSVRRVLQHNWDMLRDASQKEMHLALRDMIAEFDAECDKYDAPKFFRISWDGDFFSVPYARAWAAVIREFPCIQFWAYTRNHRAAAVLSDENLPNLALYFSADPDNKEVAARLRKDKGVKVATLHTTFAEAKELHRDITGTRVGKCPEVNGSIPLITEKGGACMTCGLCPLGKTDITFATAGR